MTVSPPAVAASRLRTLPSLIAASPDFSAVVRELTGGQPATFDGVVGSASALVAAALAADAPGPLLCVCSQVATVDDFAEDLRLFTDRPVLRFPAWEADPGERPLHDEIFGRRLQSLKQLPELTPGTLVVTSIQAVQQPVPSLAALRAGTRRFQVGQTLDLPELLAWLVGHRFQATTALRLPGEFAHRGGILDLFAPDWFQPIRIELFGDEIESIRRFDVASQRSMEALDAIELTMFRPTDMEIAHLVDYLPAHAWILALEPTELAEVGRQYRQRVDDPAACHALDDVFRHWARFPLAEICRLSPAPAAATCRLSLQTVERFSGDFHKVRDELDKHAAGDEVILVSPTVAELGRLEDIFAATEVAKAGRLHLTEGDLRTGFRIASHGVIVLSSADLFHRTEVRRTPRKHLGKAIDTFLDLHEGDLVVHLSHGIGRYRGLRLLEKDENAIEHLELEFDGGTKIYVPAARIDLVQKYVGGTKNRPKLAKIGGQTWVRQKRSAESAVVDMAAELLEIQAMRASRPGISFHQDTEWQQAFDASFPYQETPDQLTALDAIKTDMERPRPMDRLLCGDVGYGKTEVAMRAAFKAVDNGYQVAVLVPTTILAEQHYKTFRERMAEFPFDIARLSRFCPPQEERQILDGLAKGRVDIVIGTHRLASSDVLFHNLGLVVIDEEQRFGVEVKERLKTLRATVDILTLSATPIPRTLHMSLVGVRDISNLETPPEERTPVETQVTRFDENLIRHAMLRELNRGGQVYFVHNRVEDIGQVAERLQRIVPEARIRIGHGQMHEDDLEAVMVGFVEHEYDVLLATTIVESGLDIPNANTIFIDEADRYGLADLHQLRGRVGRYKHHAYCYLLVDPGKHVTPNAARRLRAIEEFDQMGAGFAISMRDLEIRGAGNLLGSQQSGHIAAVGYELYCQLLENAVRTLRNQPVKRTLDVEIDLPGKAYLPADYVPDLRAKIDFYRRLARITDFAEIAQLREELKDRFGVPPEPVQRMLAQAELRVDAAVWQVKMVRVDGAYLVFEYALRPRMEQLARLRQGKLRVVDEKRAYLTVPPQLNTPDKLLALAKSVLRPS